MQSICNTFSATYSSTLSLAHSDGIEPAMFYFTWILHYWTRSGPVPERQGGTQEFFIQGLVRQIHQGGMEKAPVWTDHYPSSGDPLQRSLQPDNSWLRPRSPHKEWCLIASFVRHSTQSWRELGTSAPESSLEWAATEVEGVTIVNVYKPPTFRLQPDSIPVFTSPCIYAGDFNCRSTTWGYSSSNPDGDILEDWASASGVHLYDPKQPDSFHSGRWNTTTNADLAFVNLVGPAPSRIILDHFPKSQHRPSLIISESPISPIPSKPVKRWNFCKANWTRFESLVDSGVDNLPPPPLNRQPGPSLLFCLRPSLSVQQKPPSLTASASVTSHYGMRSALPIIKISYIPNLERKRQQIRHQHWLTVSQETPRALGRDCTRYWLLPLQ